nr:uncharacterized protein LOC109184077 [Ipomoea trifida]
MDKRDDGRLNKKKNQPLYFSKHSFNDLSHVSPVVFLYPLKESYVAGNRARSDTNSESLSSAGKRKRKVSDRDELVTSQSFHNATVMLSETLVMVGDKLSKSIGTELTLQEKVQ